MKRHFIACLAIFAMTAAPCVETALAQSPTVAVKDTVSGIVIDRKKTPLPGAKVEIVGESTSAFTDLDGRFILRHDPSSKKIKVTYPKMKEVTKKIKPEDMTIQIGNTWRNVPESYQWFVGLDFGYSNTSVDYFSDYMGYYAPDDEYSAAQFDFYVGRVKAVGWYAKYSLSHITNKISANKFLLGGMVRLGCPLHYKLGFGYNYTSIKLAPDYEKSAFCMESGLMFRIKNWAIDYTVNFGWNDDYFNSSISLGAAFFFDK